MKLGTRVPPFLIIWKTTNIDDESEVFKGHEERPTEVTSCRHINRLSLETVRYNCSPVQMAICVVCQYLRKSCAD